MSLNVGHIGHARNDTDGAVGRTILPGNPARSRRLVGWARWKSRPRLLALNYLS